MSNGTTGSDGTPLRHATVTIGEVAYARTDDKGRFRVRGLGTGPHRVELTSRREIGEDDVAGGTRNVRLVIPR